MELLRKKKSFSELLAEFHLRKDILESFEIEIDHDSEKNDDKKENMNESEIEIWGRCGQGHAC